MSAPDARGTLSITAGVGMALLVATSIMAGLTADRRIASMDATGIAGGTLRQRIRSGPMVAPVPRAMPVTPPWPEALVAAGDVVSPVVAPAAAPLPARKDLGLAEAAQRAGAEELAQKAR